MDLMSLIDVESTNNCNEVLFCDNGSTENAKPSSATHSVATNSSDEQDGGMSCVHFP